MLNQFLFMQFIDYVNKLVYNSVLLSLYQTKVEMNPYDFDFDRQNWKFVGLISLLIIN